MSNWEFFFTVIGVIVGAGALGGAINYILIPKSELDGTSKTKSVALGIGASFLVPLFLNMISSNLLDSIRATPGEIVKLLVFAGFCLVAAISSTSFIKGISDRILKEAQEAKAVAKAADTKASEVEAAVDPIIEKETEQEDASGGPSLTTVKAAQFNLGAKERSLLEKLANGRWTLRTRTGLAKETGLPKNEVDELVEDLKEQGLVSTQTILKSGKPRKRWYITNEGRRLLS